MGGVVQVFDVQYGLPLSLHNEDAYVNLRKVEQPMIVPGPRFS